MEKLLYFILLFTRITYSHFVKSLHLYAEVNICFSLLCFFPLLSFFFLLLSKSILAQGTQWKSLFDFIFFLLNLFYLKILNIKLKI